MINKFVCLGMICLVLSAMGGLTKVSMAQNQTLSCPSGTYLTSDLKCSQAMGYVPSSNVTNMTNSSSTLATRLGQAIGHLIAPAIVSLIASRWGAEVSYDAHGNITHACIKEGGPLFNYALKSSNLTSTQLISLLASKHGLCAR